MSDDGVPGTIPNCHRCHHHFHGFPCPVCPCPTAFIDTEESA